LTPYSGNYTTIFPESSSTGTKAINYCFWVDSFVQTFVKNLKKRRGKSLVYLVRNGVEIKNLIYVGTTKDVEKRFNRGHKLTKIFDGYDKLEKATLIETIETDKAYLLGLPIILNIFFTF